MENYKKDILVDTLVSLGYLKTPRVIEAFRRIDRADFLPSHLHGKAYDNAPLSLGGGKTMSHPLIVAHMMELSHLRAGDKVLEVGTGTGWQTALLADVVYQGGQNIDALPVVVSLEPDESLAQSVIRAIDQYGFINKGIVSVVCGDAERGYANYAPYDKIFCGASIAEIPDLWKEQLKIGGNIVARVGESIVVMEKIAKNEFSSRAFWGY